MSAFVNAVEFVVEHCCNCHVPFAMTAELRNKRLNDRALFYCPNGHGQHYIGKTETQKLRDQLELAQSNLSAERGRAIALKQQRDQIGKAHKKMRNRIRNGVCPCCNRTFQNVMQHMRTEHPDFSEEKTLCTLRNMYGLTQSALAGEIGISPAYISMTENQKSVPGYIKRRIDSWMAEQEGK